MKSAGFYDKKDFITANLDYAMSLDGAASDEEIGNANTILGGFIGMSMGKGTEMTPDVFLGVDEDADVRKRLEAYQNYIRKPDLDSLRPVALREWDEDKEAFMREAEEMFPDKEQGAADREMYVFNKLADKVDKENGWTGKVKDAVNGAIYNVGDVIKDGGIDEIGLSEEDIGFLPESQRGAAREIYGFGIRDEESARFRLKSLKEKATGTGAWATDPRLGMSKDLDAARKASRMGTEPTEDVLVVIDDGASRAEIGDLPGRDFDSRRLTDRELREMKWLEARLSGDGSGFGSYDAKAAKEAEKEFREVARRGRAIAKKEEELERYAIGLRMQRIHPSLLDEDSYSLMEDSIESRGLTPDNYERFKALPDRDKAMIAPILSAMKGKRKGGFLYDAGAEFINTAIDVGKSAVMAPVNAVMMHLVEPEQYQEYMANRALLEQATYQNRGDYNYKISDWMIDAVATVPYMAAAALPYGAGLYAMGAQFADAADKAVAARGGDLYDPNYQWLKLTTAVAYSVVERLQVGGIIKPVNPITKGLYALETSAMISKPAQMMFRGGRLFVKWGRDTAWESAEEGLQGGMEGAVAAYGCGEDVARAIAEQSIEDFAGSLGAMGVLSAFGKGGGALRSSPTFTQAGLQMSAKYAEAELDEFKGMNGPADVAKSGRLGEFERKLGEVNRGYKEAGGRDGHGVQYLTSLGYTSEQAGKVSRLIDSLDQALTSDKGVVSDAEYESMSEAEREGVVSEGMRRGMVKRSMAGRGMRKRADIVMDMIAPKGSNVSVSEDENGDITYEGTIKGRDGKERKFRNTIRFVERDPITAGQLDPNSPDFDSALAQEFEDEVNNARMQDSATTGREFIPFHLEEFNASDRSVRDAELEKYDLSKPGEFHMENGVTSEGLEVMTGRIDIEKSANLKTVLHEHLHSFVRMLRESGELTDEDIENAVERFGKPRIRGELFNEEAAADEYMEMAGRGVFLVEHSALEKIYLKANEMLNAGLAIMRLNKMEAAYRKELQDGFFASVKNGNFNGIPSVYPGKTSAGPVRKDEDQPEDKGEASREEGATEEPAPDTDAEPVKTTWDAKSNDGSKTYSGSYVIQDAENLVIDPNEDMDGVTEVTSPEDVEDTGALDSGMPIVDGDGNVLAGGRTAYGLRMAAANGNLGKIEEHAREQAGLMDLEIPGDIKHPVLLRARNPEMTQEDVDGLHVSARLPLSESEEVEDKAQAAAQVVNASPDKRALVKTIKTDDQLRDGITAVFPDSPQVQEVTAGLVTDADRINTRKISEGLKSALPTIMDAKEKNGASGIDVEIPWALSQVIDFMGTKEGRRGNATDFVRFQRRTGATETVPEDVNRLAREIYKRRKSKIEVGKFLKGYAKGLREGLDTHDALELEMLNEGETRYSISKVRPSSTAELQYEAVRNKYFGTDKWMKAPNGEPTKLTERQWIQVRTPNFKAWFGDWENDPENASKVIDENGEPLVVYHGTRMADFWEFDQDYNDEREDGELDKGFFFTSNIAMARSYAGESADVVREEDEGDEYSDTTAPYESKTPDDRLPGLTVRPGLYASFLNIRDPERVDAKGEDWDNISIGEDQKDAKSFYSLDEDVQIKIANALFRDGDIGTKVEIDEDGEWENFSEISDEIEDYYRRQYGEEDDDGNLISEGEMPKFMPDGTEATDGKYVTTTRDFTNANIGEGNDGVIFDNVHDFGRFVFRFGPGDVYVALDPDQIKSATDNNGDFSKDNDDIRYSISKIRGVYGGDNLYTAFMIGEVLNKRYEKRDPEDYETIRRVFGASLSPDEAHDFAVRYLEDDKEGRAQRLYKKLTPAKAMTAVGSELEKSQIGKIMAEMGRGASFGAAYGSLASNTFMNQQKKAVKDARGAHLADLEAAYGVDISSIVEAASERTVAEAKRKRAEKNRKKKPEDGEGVEVIDEDEEGVVIETVDDPGSDVSIGRQEETHSRLEALFAELKKTSDPIQRDELIKKYQVAEKDKDVADSILRAKMISEFGADVMADGGVFDLVSTLVRDYTRVASGGYGDKMWLNAGAIETYKLTMADVLTQLMCDMVPSKRGNDRVNITKTIERMKSVYPSTIKTVKDGLKAKATIDRLAKKAVVQIQKASVKATKKELIDNLDKACKKLVKSNDKDALAEFTKKTIEGQVGVIAKMVRRAIRMNSNEVGEKIEKLNNELNEIQSRYDEEGAEALDGSQDRNVVLKQMELRVLDIFGALNERSIADIQNVSDFAKEYFEVNLQRFLRRQDEIRRRIDEAKAILVSTLPKDIPASGKDSWATRFGNWNAATLRSRLTLAVAGVKDEKERERALRLVDDIMFLVSESSQKRIVLNNKYANMMAEAVRRSIDGTGHSPRWFMDKMTEKIPDELSRQITRQDHYNGGGKDSRMTWDQLMHVYGFLCQPTSYLNNIEKHNRQGQKEIIEVNTPPEILRFVKNLREVYEERRAELSQAMMDVTGFPVFRADPMFLPVRMFIGNKSGLSTQMLSVNNAIAPSLAPRVKNDRDVDESVGLMSLYHTSSKQVANAIAFGSSGIYLRDVLTGGEFLGGIKRAYGEGEAEGLRNQVTDLITDGYRLPQGKDIEGSIAFMNTVVTYASLSGNLASAGKQLGGIPSWVAVMRSGKYREVWKYILQFDRDAMRELVESDGFYARYGENGASLTSIWKILKDPNERILMRPLKAGMVPLQMADKWASIIVGAGLYKANVERLSRMGLGDAEAKHRAMIETWAAVEEAQQSDRIENTNEFMRRRGILAKSMMKFASSPMLQASNESQAFRVAYRSGRSEDWRKAGNIFFANHVFIPLLMQLADFVVDLAMHEEPEDDEWKTRFLEALVASIIGQYGRILFVGSLSETFMREAVGLKTWHTSGIASYDYAYKMTRFAASSIHDLFGGDFDGAWDNFWKSILSSTAAIRYSSRFAENWGLLGLDKED